MMASCLDCRATAFHLAGSDTSTAFEYPFRRDVPSIHWIAGDVTGVILPQRHRCVGFPKGFGLIIEYLASFDSGLLISFQQPAQ
jgi:hypothetical protein